MKKLIAMFKSLPPEVRMMVAMAGLGTPFGAIYVLKRFLFPTMSMFMVIIIVAGAIGVICLLGFILAKIFGRGKKKRSKKMAGDLAAEADGGRVSVDVGAAIKANNEKFFKAIRDMKKSTGGNIYDLPWYIVIGDSGCGKTKLVNESGLIFSLGRPEGYQLGTLDYNWWFTEDAIFIDMAGRLVNPQEDEDRREWQAFLGTIAKGRKGYPINGALVCVSAEHLLQDSPEKVEQDANTTLERLRDLQSKLGVTFATYLIITKCDKLLGFMQFFDRATRDIMFKNQMFGWSRPGDFNELHDPEQFGADFDVLYQRLNELRLGRLQDEADEIDLGLAYSFPEEFRQMLPPLQTYVRTLFPMIKNPRAIKNLIFRGTYFTSATQEGALILKHLAERLGEEAASQFAPLDDLYPTKRPHFIKDLLVEKVFPEHGLVFRNEKQALRNRKLSKLLRVGSVALVVLLFCTLGLSAWQFGKVITDPRKHAIATKPQDAYVSSQAVTRGNDLGHDVATLHAKRFWAILLSLGTGADTPIKHLNTIRAGLFEKNLLREALVEVSTALRREKLGDPRDGQEARDKADRYMAALEQYITWYACIGEASPPTRLTHASFQELRGVVPEGESPVAADKGFSEQATNYFNIIRGEGDWLNPARLLRDEDVDPVETLATALKTVHGYWRHYARLDDTHPDEDIREWMRIHTQCTAIMDRYNRMLDTAGAKRETLEHWKAFREQFNTDYENLAQAVGGLKWQLGEASAVRRIPLLHDAIGRQRAAWFDYQNKLSEAYHVEEGVPDESISRGIAALSAGDSDMGLGGLDRVLLHELKQAGLANAEWSYEPTYVENLATYVESVHEHFAHIILFNKGTEGSPDEIVPSAYVRLAVEKLRVINANFLAANFEPSRTSRSPEDWVTKLEALYNQLYDSGEESDEEDDDEPQLESWRQEDLDTLYKAHQRDIWRVEGRALLSGIKLHLRPDDLGKWGFAELYPVVGRFTRIKSQYNITVPDVGEGRDTRKASRDQPRKEPKRKKKRRSRSRGEREEDARPRQPSAGVPLEGGGYIPACTTRAYLRNLAEDCADLRDWLVVFDDDFYLPSEDDPEPLNELCLERIKQACRKYMKTYVREWAQAYQNKKLAELQHLAERSEDWREFSKRMEDSSQVNKVSDELEQSLAEILGVLPFWSYDKDNNDEWYDRTEYDEHSRTVGAWMRDSIEQEWPMESLGRFALRVEFPEGEIRPGSQNEAPWKRLAGEFAGRWKDLALVISQARLSQKFQRKANKSLEPIRWGRIEALRREARLDKERLTGQFTAFEQEAQKLLSAALTEALWRIQSKYFPKSPEVYDGWPYLGSESSGGLKALETVAFPEFKQFVRDVNRAAEAFEPLERGLPAEPLSAARGVFCGGCKAWKSFIGIEDELKTTDLEVTIEGKDPLQKPVGKYKVEDTAQYHYNAMQLNLGLAIRDEATGSSSYASLRIPTKTEDKVGKPQKAVWTWTKPPDNPTFTVSLVDSPKDLGYPTMEHTLGKSSPLAFCAYLHRHGVLDPEDNDRHKWITSHGFDLRKEFRLREDEGKINKLDTINVVGEGFIFTLDRSLPPPIKKLKPATAYDD